MCNCVSLLKLKLVRYFFTYFVFFFVCLFLSLRTDYVTITVFNFEMRHLCTRDESGQEVPFEMFLNAILSATHTYLLKHTWQKHFEIRLHLFKSFFIFNEPNILPLYTKLCVWITLRGFLATQYHSLTI